MPKCVCCKRRLAVDELAFCAECNELFFREIDRDCGICTKKLSECSCAPEYLRNHFVKKLSKVYRYSGKNTRPILSSVIYSLKEHARRDTVKFAAELLTESIRNTQQLPGDVIITNVPRRPSAILKYGHDHSALIARAVAKNLGAEYKKILKSKTKTEQKQLTRLERMQNIKVEPIRDLDLSGKSILIIDDIVTSGASLATCASVIRSLGCKRISAAALAISYRDRI